MTLRSVVGRAKGLPDLLTKRLVKFEKENANHVRTDYDKGTAQV